MDKNELLSSKEIGEMFEINKTQMSFLEKGEQIDFSKIIEK